MIRVLIVDDDADKVRRVVTCLRGAGVPEDRIDECRDALRAIQLLQANSYDLLVLDIVLPERIDQEPSQDGGTKLLKELSQRGKYMAPDHVVGLTAYDNAYDVAVEPFMAKSWTIIRFDLSGEEWCQQLADKAEQIIWARESRASATKDYCTHLAIVCALEDPELSAIRRLPWGWEKVRHNGDPTLYYRGEYTLRGRQYVVHAASAARMGMTAAAILATKMALAFQPRYVTNVGITAAIKARANYGDVISAEMTWDYGSGKFGIVDGIRRFLPAPNQHRLDADLRGKLVEMAQDETIFHAISKGWEGDRPDTRLRLLVGPVASGASVVADETKSREIASQHPKVLGVEMETYAVFDAAEECPQPRPAAFSLKGVCDFADSRKDDRFQRYAAYTSAETLRCFIERFVF